MPRRIRQVNFGAGSAGYQLMGELLNDRAGLQTVHVPLQERRRDYDRRGLGHGGLCVCRGHRGAGAGQGAGA